MYKNLNNSSILKMFEIQINLNIYGFTILKLFYVSQISLKK